jgi:hypothetical protein
MGCPGIPLSHDAKPGPFDPIPAGPLLARPEVSTTPLSKMSGEVTVVENTPFAESWQVSTGFMPITPGPSNLFIITEAVTVLEVTTNCADDLPAKATAIANTTPNI